MPDETRNVGSAERAAAGGERGDSFDRANPVAGVAEIVARIPLAEAGREMVDAFRSEIPAFERLSGPTQGDIVEGVERNLRRWPPACGGGVGS